MKTIFTFAELFCTATLSDLLGKSAVYLTWLVEFSHIASERQCQDAKAEGASGD